MGLKTDVNIQIAFIAEILFPVNRLLSFIFLVPESKALNIKHNACFYPLPHGRGLERWGLEIGILVLVSFLVFMVVRCRFLGENQIKTVKNALIAIKSALRTEILFELVWPKVYNPKSQGRIEAL